MTHEFIGQSPDITVDQSEQAEAREQHQSSFGRFKHRDDADALLGAYEHGLSLFCVAVGEVCVSALATSSSNCRSMTCRRASIW